MIEIPRIKRGEERFLKKFEEIHKETHLALGQKEAEEKVRHTIEQIKKEIQDLPEIQREEIFHPNMTVQQTTNILAQALQIALDEDPAKALAFIYRIGNPFLIDTFHDILIGHYLNLLKEKGKIKIEE